MIVVNDPGDASNERLTNGPGGRGIGRHEERRTLHLACLNATRRHSADVAEMLEGLVPFGAWGFKSPLRHPEHMLDPELGRE